MFTTLYELAKQAPLMISIAPEGEDALRVNVTPVPADGKSKSGLPAPLSLLATPAEFDAEFADALAAWRAPKRTLMQQAQDAASTAVPAPGATAAPKLPAPKEKEKPKGGGRKPRGAAPEAADDAGDDGQAGPLDAVGDAGDAAGADVNLEQPDDAAPPADEAADAPAAPIAAPELTAADLTLDLF